MLLKYNPNVDQFSLDGVKVSVTGRRGPLLWVAPTFKNGNPKITRRKSTPTHSVMVGGPWDGSTIRYAWRRKKGPEFLELSDIWFHPSFNGWYLLDRDTMTYTWRNP